MVMTVSGGSELDTSLAVLEAAGGVSAIGPLDLWPICGIRYYSINYSLC